jgi:hypothetical protein
MKLSENELLRVVTDALHEPCLNSRLQHGDVAHSADAQRVTRAVWDLLVVRQKQSDGHRV